MIDSRSTKELRMNFTPLIESSAPPFPTVFIILLVVGGALFFFGGMISALGKNENVALIVSIVGLVIAFIGILTGGYSTAYSAVALDETIKNADIIKDNVSEKYQFETREMKVVDKVDSNVSGSEVYNINVHGEASILSLDVAFDETGEPTIVTDDQLTQDDVEELLR